MRQRLFTLLAVLSLLPLAAVLALWGVSRFRAVSLTYMDRRDSRMEEMSSRLSRGSLALSFYFLDTDADLNRTMTAVGLPEGRWCTLAYTDRAVDLLPADGPPADVMILGDWYLDLPGGVYLRSSQYTWRRNSRATDTRSLFLPLWIPSALLAALPTARLTQAARRRLRRRGHSRAGHCPDCGYDLRATHDPTGPRFQRCPECGGVPSLPLSRPSACLTAIRRCSLAVCLLLLVGCIALWARSWFRSDAVAVGPERSKRYVVAARVLTGGLMLGYERLPVEINGSYSQRCLRLMRQSDPRSLADTIDAERFPRRMLGFGRSADAGNSFPHWVVRIPFWPPVLLCTLYLWWFGRRPGSRPRTHNPRIPVQPVQPA